MPDVTIFLNDELLKKSREYARKHRISLNALICKLLHQAVISKSENWLDECFDLMDRANAESKSAKWTREELYER